MKQRITDGGPAFPHTRVEADSSGRRESGLTIRDYFATHGPMPGEAEIADHCKVVLKTHADPYTDAPTFGTWWAGLSLEEKCDAFAGVRYAIADVPCSARGTNERPRNRPLGAHGDRVRFIGGGGGLGLFGVRHGRSMVATGRAMAGMVRERWRK